MASSFVTGKTVLITGCTAGIGKAMVRELASRGPKILALLARNEAKLQELKSDLSAAFPDKEIEYKIYVADLSSPFQTMAVAEKVVSELDSLDIFVNNAGLFIVLPNKRLLVDLGEKFADVPLEKHFATNYLSMVILMNAFLPLLQKSAENSNGRSRIVITGSFTALQTAGGKVDFNNLQGEGRRRVINANDIPYSQSKLLQHIYAKDFAKRDDVKDKVDVCVFDPGMVKTDIEAFQCFKRIPGSSFLFWLFGLREPVQGAAPGLWLCDKASEEIGTGTYLDWNLLGDGRHRKPVEIGIFPFSRNRKAQACYDEAVITKVVDYTHTLLKKLEIDL